MIHLVDANNYVRRMFEADRTGLCLRNMAYAVERSPDVEAWVWDGPGSLKRRRELYPNYKKRPPVAEDIFQTMALFQGCLLHTKAIQIRVPGWEADDVIATLAQKYDTPVQITSTDKDFLQLLQFENVKLDRDPIPGVDASYVRLYKTLVGDSSDKISGIPGFGEKAWATCNKDAFRELVETRFAYMPDDADKAMEYYGVSKRVANWLLVPENIGLLHVMHDIIGFYSVPQDEIEANTVVGTSNPQKLEATLAEFYQ